jgi:hypothetical protein
MLRRSKHATPGNGRINPCCAKGRQAHLEQHGGGCNFIARAAISGATRPKKGPPRIQRAEFSS